MGSHVMNNKRKKLIFILFSAILVSIFLLDVSNFTPPPRKIFEKEKITVHHGHMFSRAIEVADRTYEGIIFLKVKSDSVYVIRNGFDFKNNSIGQISFNIGLSCISMYYATGVEKFLDVAKKTADLLNRKLPQTGLIPEIEWKDSNIVLANDSVTFMSPTQATLLEFVCHLAKIDSSYDQLVVKLSDGIINYGLNSKSGQVYQAVNTYSGLAIHFPEIGYESQLGSVSSNVAQALLTAYDVTKNVSYKQTALRILKSIWERRNINTNLIPETWDIVKDSVGLKMYPYGDFRFDDMGGAYLRALMPAYSLTGDKEILSIINLYTASLLKYVWDERIAGGGFRYFTSTVSGKGSEQLETMYGLFIGTMLRCSKYLSDENLKQDILMKCQEHADHIFMTNYGVKNFMIPHSLSEDGKYSQKTNDSQLGYAVLQFPYGMQLLSTMTGDNNYRERCFQIVDTMIERYAIGDNIHSPKGYVNILETKPPFGFEIDYSSPKWCYMFEFLPSYLLYSSVQPSQGVQINWQDENEPNVYFLVEGMPYWDLNKVKFDFEQKTFFCEVNSKEENGYVKFDDLGFSGIKTVSCDDVFFNKFQGNKLEVRKGKHFYKIFFK